MEPAAPEPAPGPSEAVRCACCLALGRDTARQHRRRIRRAVHLDRRRHAGQPAIPDLRPHHLRSAPKRRYLHSVFRAVRVNGVADAARRRFGLCLGVPESRAAAARYSLTLAGTFVAFFAGVKPAGVSIEITVRPRLSGVKRLTAWSVPGAIVSGDSTVPTAGSLLCRTTVALTPARSGCTVISAARPVSRSR